MKKDRNYGMSSYPMYQGNPMMMQPMPGMMQPMPGMTSTPNILQEQPGFQQMGITSQDITNINHRLDTIERRLTNLENVCGTKKPTTHDSNYQMI